MNPTKRPIQVWKKKTAVDTIYKGTVSVISSDPLYEDGNALFPTLPSKAFSDEN